MVGRRKNTRAYARENPKILLYKKFPKGGRKNWPKKKGGFSHTWKPRDNPHYQPIVEK